MATLESVLGTSLGKLQKPSKTRLVRGSVSKSPSPQAPNVLGAPPAPPQCSSRLEGYFRLEARGSSDPAAFSPGPRRGAARLRAARASASRPLRTLTRQPGPAAPEEASQAPSRTHYESTETELSAKDNGRAPSDSTAILPASGGMSMAVTPGPRLGSCVAVPLSAEVPGPSQTRPRPAQRSPPPPSSPASLWLPRELPGSLRGPSLAQRPSPPSIASPTKGSACRPAGFAFY